MGLGFEMSEHKPTGVSALLVGLLGFDLCGRANAKKQADRSVGST
jgi:hypothetical protein